MKLLTKELRKSFPDLYETENIPLKDKVVLCHFFTPDSNWDWYAIELSKEDGNTFWGYVRALKASGATSA